MIQDPRPQNIVVGNRLPDEKEYFSVIDSTRLHKVGQKRRIIAILKEVLGVSTLKISSSSFFISAIAYERLGENKEELENSRGGCL